MASGDGLQSLIKLLTPDDATEQTNNVRWTMVEEVVWFSYNLNKLSVLCNSVGFVPFKMKVDLDGIIPAAFTPMLDNGDLNLDAIDEYVAYFERESISNVFILGTAGEGCNLSVDERKSVAEKWLKAAKNRIATIVVHIGACNIADTKALAKHAESIGASAIATLPSFFFKPASPKHLAIYLAEISKAAPNTPMMYYHVPVLTGVNFNVEHIIDEIQKIGIPQFAGVKFTGHDLCDFGRCVEKYGDQYSICYGYDEQAFAGLLLGCQSIVGSTYNFALKLYKRLFEACKKQDVEKVKEEQFKSQKMISYLFSVGLDVGISKALMLPVAGIDFGPPRLPIEPPTKEKVDSVMHHLKEMGAFD